jgi:hypothetical protein
LQGRLTAVVAALCSLIRSLRRVMTGLQRPVHCVSLIEHRSITKSAAVRIGVRELAFTTDWQPDLTILLNMHAPNAISPPANALKKTGSSFGF